MKKFISILLAAVLSFSLAGCKSASEQNDATPQEPVEVSAYKQLYDYINENGKELTGSKALMASVEESYISVIAKSESTVELMLLSETEELSTKVSIVLTEGQPEHKVSLVSKVGNISNTYEGYITAETYDADNPEISSFYSASPDSMHDDEKKALAAAINYTLALSDKVMEKSSVSIKDLGFEKFSIE